MKRKAYERTLSQFGRKIAPNIVLSVLVLTIGVLSLAPMENSIRADGEETKLYRSAGENAKGVSLMFNVYWGTDEVYKILDILTENNAKATFFVIGNTGKLDYVKQIHARGHVVGLHSDTHRYEIIYRSTDAYFADLDAISSKVEQLIGIKSKIIRFPGGGSNGVSKQYCKGIMTRLTNQVKAKGYAYFDWNVSSGDASGNNVPANQLVSNVLTQAKNKNSICVLMHDNAAKKTTVEALPAMLEGLASMGYRFEGLTVNSNGYWHHVNN